MKNNQQFFKYNEGKKKQHRGYFFSRVMFGANVRPFALKDALSWIGPIVVLVMAFVMSGCLAGYLWHNSYPSAVLMGDAGSRPIGLLLGILVLACGNPFLILVVAFMVLVNGATGMIKVALLRFFKIGIFRQIRYPLHDHVRHKLGWSNTQVLVRFMLLQAVGTPILLVLLLKVR